MGRPDIGCKPRLPKTLAIHYRTASTAGRTEIQKGGNVTDQNANRLFPLSSPSVDICVGRKQIEHLTGACLPWTIFWKPNEISRRRYDYYHGIERKSGWGDSLIHPGGPRIHLHCKWGHLWENGHQVICKKKENFVRCNDEWAKDEAKAFASGTAEFCVFAMEVEPLLPNKKDVFCGKDRMIAGNGKGRPVPGANFPSVSGAEEPTYRSTTSIKHMVGGLAVYVDSAAVPGLVSPDSSLLGSVVWVNYPKGKHATFAVVNDTGKSYGEGTVALHQLLHRGALRPQATGPIAVKDRCTDIELANLEAPFTSKPDLGKSDQCRRGFKPKGPTEIRAYEAISSGVQVILLPKVKFKMHGNVVQEEITIPSMKKLSESAGYSENQLSQMAQCVKK